MRTVRAAALAAAILSLSGCITFLSEIHLNPDGSGTMVQTMTMNPQAMKGALDSVAKGMGASGGEVKETKTEEKGPFDDKALAEKAKDLGEGVTFVSAEKIDTKTAGGARVTYKFRDINTLAVNPKPGAAMGTEGSGKSAKGAMKFHFERRGDRSVLTVLLPPSEKKAEAPPPASSPEMDEQQMAMFKQMMKGLHIGLSVEVNGRLIETTSPYRAGNKVTLFDVDFDPLLAKPETLKALNARLSSAGGDDAKTAAALSEFPGMKINTKPEIRIEFSGK